MMGVNEWGVSCCRGMSFIFLGVNNKDQSYFKGESCQEIDCKICGGEKITFVRRKSDDYKLCSVIDGIKNLLNMN